MALANTSQLIADIQTIMDNPPAGGSEAIAESWANALSSWLVTVSTPPVETLTPGALAVVIKPILSVDFTIGGTINPPSSTPDFIQLLNLALIAAAGVILLDPLVAPLVSAGTVLPPIGTVTFNIPKTIGMAGGSSKAVATAMAADLLTWSLTGVSPAGTWI